MDQTLISLKERYITMLRRWTIWGKNDDELEKEAEAMFNLIEWVDISLEQFKLRYKIKPETRLLIDTNTILSPIQLDNLIELPLFELFFDNENFLVFTTNTIYSCKNNILQISNYTEILSRRFT